MFLANARSCNDSSVVESHKVFVGHLPKNCDEDTLLLYFSNFGTVTEILVKRDPAGQTRGFCFVSFDSPEPVAELLATRALNNINGHWIDVKQALAEGVRETKKSLGSTGACDACSSGGYRFNSASTPTFKTAEKLADLRTSFESNKVFVGHLPKNCGEEAVLQYFSNFGTVTEVLVKRDPAGQTRGFCFVSFDKPDPVCTLISNHASNNIHGHWIDVKPAVTEGARGLRKGNSISCTGGGFGPVPVPGFNADALYQPY